MMIQKKLAHRSFHSKLFVSKTNWGDLRGADHYCSYQNNTNQIPLYTRKIVYNTVNEVCVFF